MQKGIIVRVAGVMMVKAVFAGDTSNTTMDAEQARLLALYPDAEITFYESDQDPAFIGAN